jgi:hypothetical protein
MRLSLFAAIGQALRATKAKEIYSQNSKSFKRLQEVRFHSARAIQTCVEERRPTYYNFFLEDYPSRDRLERFLQCVLGWFGAWT